jgi:hypothetical protein
LSTKTKTLEGIKTNLFEKLSRFPEQKMLQMRETISQLIELSKKPDEFLAYQTESFDKLMEKVRELVDDMVNEQHEGDVLYKNTSNLLMRYHLRQEHALEMVEDKHQLMSYFIEFVNSIEEIKGSIDVNTNYPKLLLVLRAILQKYMEFKRFEEIFAGKFNSIYQNLKNSTQELKEKLKDSQNPYKQDGMKIIADNLNSLRVAAQAKVAHDFLYNVNPDLEINMINRYINYFEEQSSNDTISITPHFFPSFVEEERKGKEEIIVMSNLLEQAKESLKLTENAINSNLKEHLANTKTRKDVIDVIYQILELINKRSKKIKGYQLKYIENITKYFDDKTHDFSFERYKKYEFINITAEELLNKPLPQLPKDVSGLEDDNTAVPQLQSHIPLNVNNNTVNLE